MILTTWGYENSDATCPSCGHDEMIRSEGYTIDSDAGHKEFISYACVNCLETFDEHEIEFNAR